MSILNTLNQALQYLEKEPALETMSETREDVRKAKNWLDKFCLKADDALLKKSRTFFELVKEVNKRKPASVTAAAKRAGLSKIPQPKKKRDEAIALLAIKEGKGEVFSAELGKSDNTVLREEFLSLAALDEAEIPKEVRKRLTPTKREKYAKACGFEIAYKIGKSGNSKGTKTYDAKGTLENAMAILDPYINSMRDAR